MPGRMFAHKKSTSIGGVEFELRGVVPGTVRDQVLGKGSRFVDVAGRVGVEEGGVDVDRFTFLLYTCLVAHLNETPGRACCSPQ